MPGQISTGRFMAYPQSACLEVNILILEFENIFMERQEDFKLIFDSNTPQTEPIPHFSEILNEF